MVKLDSEIILRYITALQGYAWPIIVLLVLGYWYRQNIRSFIDRLHRFKGFGLEAEAEKLAQQNQNNEQQIQAAVEEAEQVVSDSQSIEDVREQLRSEYDSKLNETQNNARDIVEALLKQLSSKELQLDFERIYHAIFGSQIALLERIMSLPSGASRSFLESYFHSVRANFPSIGDWDLDRYLGFLIGNGLLSFSADGYCTATSKASGFLEYISARRYNKNKVL